MTAGSGEPGGGGQPTHGRPGWCLLAGGLMLAVPTVVALAHLPGARGGVAPGTGLVIAVVLAIGAAAVATATLRPAGSAMPALAVLCTVFALVLEPPEPVGDGLCGLACLAFLLAVRLDRQSRVGPVDLADWFAAHRPMAIGAAVTTPAAVAAATVPAGWSLLAAASVGVVSAVLCAVLFLS